MTFVKGDKPRLKILFFTALLYVVVLFLLTFWKYITNKYNGLDLAIYNQVFWNLVHGNGFASSIQSGSLLGDHAEFGILLLLPFYFLFPHPLALLALQTIALASTVFPIYLLATFIFSSYDERQGKTGAWYRREYLRKQSWLKKLWYIFEKFGFPLGDRANTYENNRGTLAAGSADESAAQARALGTRAAGARETVFSKNLHDPIFLQNLLQSSSLPLSLSLLWLINPIVWNINFFEFHIVPFFIPLFLWTIYFYLRGNYGWYFLFLALSIFIREDVAFVAFMLGFLIFLKQKKLGIITMVLSISWFFIATRLMTYFSYDAEFKFFPYYSWLGSSFSEILTTMMQHPIFVAKHIFTILNLEMTTGFFLSFIFVPLFAPQFLLLTLPSFLQFAFINGTGSGMLVLQTHYAALFLPGLVLSQIFGTRYLLRKFAIHKNLIITLFIIASFYGLFTLSPLIAAVRAIHTDIAQKNWLEENKIFSLIPRDATVAATHTPLSKISSRAGVYSAHYMYVGKRWSTNLDYPVPHYPDFLAFDEGELRGIKAQYDTLAWSSKFTHDGWERLQNLINNGEYGLMARAKTLVLLKKDSVKIYGSYVLPHVPDGFRGYTTLNGIRSIETKIFQH